MENHLHELIFFILRMRKNQLVGLWVEFLVTGLEDVGYIWKKIDEFDNI